MLAAIPILLLLAAPVTMQVIRLVRPRFAFFWLAAAVTVLITWPMVLVAGMRLPASIPLFTWQPAEVLPVSPELLVDSVSWSLALALAALALAVILTGVAQAPQADYQAWAASLVLVGLGMVAVLSANPITLLMAWAAIDLVEVLILLRQVEMTADRERVIIAFAARVAGIMVVLWATLAASARGESIDFRSLSQATSVYLLLGSGLRLGVIPLHLTLFNERTTSRGLETLLRLIPASASLILLVRAAPAGIPEQWQNIFLIVAGLSALYGAIQWASAVDEMEGSPAWILGMASLVLAAAVRGQATAALAWAAALLLSGGLLFLSILRPRRLTLLTVLGFLAMSTLPLTPTWHAVRLYTLPFHPTYILFLMAQTLLMAGYLRHALRVEQSYPVAERWIWLIYPWGLGLLLISHVILDWGSRQAGYPTLQDSWPAGAALVLLALLILVVRRKPRFSAGLLARLGRLLSFRWVYQVLWSIYRSLGRTAEFVTRVLEGEGGFLWTLLLLALLLSYLAQLTSSGG